MSEAKENLDEEFYYHAIRYVRSHAVELGIDPDRIAARRPQDSGRDFAN